MEIERTTVVAASPDEVAAFVTDLERWPEWFALWKGWSKDVPQGPARKGVRFKHKVRILGVPADVEWEVVEVDLPGTVRLKGKSMSRTSTEVDFRSRAVDGGTEIAVRAKLGGMALIPVKGQLKPWLEARVDRTIDGLQRELGTP